MNLPTLFLQRLEKQLGKDHISHFLKSMQLPPIESIYIHKPIQPQLQSSLLDRVPWHTHGYYVNPSSIHNHHPYHLAGAFHFQEASSMAMVPMLDVQPSDVVLDMNASSGYKSIDIASRLGSQGFLIANDMDGRKAQTLMLNIERIGLSQAIVTQHDPHHLPKLFPNFFDKILVDAPGSQEGTFRQNPNSVDAWSIDFIQTNAKRQGRLLEDAVSLLKPGGRIVYSTNTFAPEESELLIENFLQKHPDFKILNHESYSNFDSKSTRGVGVKLWPHLVKGEGYYIVALQHLGEKSKPIKFTHRMKNPMPPAWKQFAEENLINLNIQPNFVLDERMFQIPISYQFHSALHTLRAGVYFGEIQKNIYYPSHHLAHYLQPQDVKQSLDLSIQDPRLMHYLRGEEMDADVEKGWILIMVNGISLGWGKASQGRIKNHYPKSLRLTHAYK